MNKNLVNVLKILGGFAVGGGVGYTIGKTVADRKYVKYQETCCKDCKACCDNCDLYKIAKDVGLIEKPPEEVENARKEYAGEDINGEALRYDANPDGTFVKAAEEPEMPEEPAQIGDEDTVEASPAVILISEAEFYNNAGGLAQEDLLWYVEDEVLFNKETQTKLTPHEIKRCVGMDILRGAFQIDPLHEPEDKIYVRNDMIPCMFQIFRIDAAYADEHDSGEIDEDE